MGLPDVAISRHAWARFLERRVGEGCPEAELKSIMANAVPEDLGAASVIRLMANNYRGAKYYHHGGWRLVLDENETELITIERRVLKPIKRAKKKPPPERRRGVWK